MLLLHVSGLLSTRLGLMKNIWSIFLPVVKRVTDIASILICTTRKSWDKMPYFISKVNLALGKWSYSVCEFTFTRSPLCLLQEHIRWARHPQCLGDLTMNWSPQGMTLTSNCGTSNTNPRHDSKFGIFINYFSCIFRIVMYLYVWKNHK